MLMFGCFATQVFVRQSVQSLKTVSKTVFMFLLDVFFLIERGTSGGLDCLLSGIERVLFTSLWLSSNTAYFARE